MQLDFAERECWAAALRLLDGDLYAHGVRFPGRQRGAGAIPAGPADASTSSERVVRVIDRVSADVVVVYWCDATACRYGDQLWKRGVAKQDGRCALSGASVSAGDLVYRPRGRPRPVNATAMMLASEVDGRTPG